MKLTEQEKLTLESLHSLSGVSLSNVREVFLAMLFMLAIEFRRGTNQITIPFFGDFKMDYQQVGGEVVDHTFVKLSPLLRGVLTDYLSGKESVVEQHLRGDITRKLAESLGLDASKEFSLLN